MSKKSDELIKEESFKEELENILDEMDNVNFIKVSNTDTTMLNIDEHIAVSKFMDFDAIKIGADKEASEIVDSIVGFYIKDEINDEARGKRFLASKMNTDKMTVSNLIFQMKTAEHAIKRLLEEIDAGNMHPRQFEVLASLQKSKMEIIKHLSFVQIQMENNYKTIRQEQEHLYDTTPSDDELHGGFGSKGLLRRLKENNAVTLDMEDVEIN